MLCFLLLAVSASLPRSVPPPPPPLPPKISHQQFLGTADCRIGITNNSIALSGTTTVRISIMGKAPVEVEPIRSFSDSPNWAVKAQPPYVYPREEGREEWSQTFVLEPFQTGDVALPIKPIRFRTGNEVRDWTLTWPTSTIRVTTMVEKPELSSAHPVTDVESLPPAPDRSQVWRYVAGFLVFVAVAVGLAVWLRRRHVIDYEPLSPREWITAELERLDRDGISAEQLPDLANVLRQFLERQFHLTATRQTSAEFRTTLENRELLSIDHINELFTILTECDFVKFAGAKPPREACESLLIRARTLVAAVGEVKQANPAG